ncbi:oxidoreductase, aldo/keto reductase domain protein [Fusobacterium sp. CM22]|nr:oxidoreductase, aldo/keto reductase domain protein [Fusobacterium sp. CM22]
MRAIGVSNFFPDRFVDFVHFVEIKPIVNQVETHVFNQQIIPQEIMKEYGTQIESWGPFAEGKNNLFTNETLVEIGKKYNKTAAQIALRYLIQRDVVVIPKTVRKERMIQNFDVFNFELNEEDMKEILKLDKKESLFLSHYDPETVKLLVNYKI